jgi:hypothetical protein
MALGKTEQLDEIFRLLNQQRQILNRWPLTNEQIRKDKEISARIRNLIDQICTSPSTAGTVKSSAVHVGRAALSKM